MAKLPFQQTKVLPGAEVGAFKSSGITPPPSLQGVIDSGTQFYGAQMDVAESMMDLGQTIAKAVMIDKNEKERKRKIEEDQFEDEKLGFMAEKLFQLEKNYIYEPEKYEAASKKLFLDSKEGSRSVLSGFINDAKKRGFSEPFIARLTRNIKSMGLQSNRAMWRQAMDQDEFKYKRQRSYHEDKATNKYVRDLFRTELDLTIEENEVLDDNRIARIEQGLQQIADQIVTVGNGYTGKDYPDDEARTLKKGQIVEQLRKDLITSENRWNHTALQRRLRRENKEENEAYLDAESELVQSFINAQVYDIENLSTDTYDRTDIQEDITRIASVQAFKIYPSKIVDGKDENAVKRSEFMEETIGALNRKFVEENGSLKVQNARRAAQKVLEDEQEEERIAALDQQNRETEAANALNREISKINSAFINGDIDVEEAIKQAEEYKELVGDFYKLSVKGLTEQEKKKKTELNRRLIGNLETLITSDDLSWRAAEAQKKLTETREQKRLEANERAKYVRREVDLAASEYLELASQLFLDQQKNPKDDREFKNALNGVLDKIIMERAGDGEDFVDEELAEAIDSELNNVVIQDWYQVASKQQSDAITLEASQASIDYIYGKDGKPGLNRILEEAFNKDMTWKDTSNDIEKEIRLLQERTSLGLSDEAKERFINSPELREQKEAKIETLRNQVTQREDEKLKVSLERRMNDVATGRDLGQFKAPPRTFRDAENLLTNRQESDWRMVHIANLLEEHVGDVDGLYSRDEAIQILGKYAERIDRADALGLIDRDPIAAEKALAPVKQGNLDALFPNLQPDERERLKIQAGNSIQQGRTGSKADIRNQFNNEIKRVLANDYQFDESSEMLDGSDPTFMERIVKPLVGDPEQGGLYEQWEYEVMQSKMQYAKEISKAVNGGNPKYGNERLEYKTAEQLQALLADFKPGTFDAGYVEQGKRYDRGFMDEVYNSFAQGVHQILTKRASDPAFYPADRWKEMMKERGAQVNMFSRERAEYIMEQQEAFAPGSMPKLFTNAELEGIDAEWNDADSLGRAGMLNEMQQTVSDPTIFSQMFNDVAENTSVNYSDQLYLEHKDNGAILRRLQTARQLNMSDINTKLGTLETDLETFDVELFENEQLNHFLAAFSDEPNRMADWYQLVRSYAVTGMRDDDSDKAVTESVQQLLSSKYHIHSGDPNEDDIEGSSIWIPKQFIPDRPADMGGLMEEQTRFEPITKDDFTKSLQRFVKDEVPALVGKNTYAASAAGNYHFRNSDDGQGLTLHFFSEAGSYPVPDKEGNTIQLNWDQLRNLVFDVRSLGYKAGRIPKERVDLRLRSYQEQMQLQEVR